MHVKILMVGIGGIGSTLLKEICECIDQEQIPPSIQITIADNDTIEIAQTKVYNYELKEAGQNKAETLAKRYETYGINAISKRITTEKQLKEYDIIILCADNEKIRELVIRHCHKKGKEFLDLRATGRRVFCMHKTEKLKDNLKFIDSKDMNEYSCQDKNDKKKGRIQKGYKIAAACGIQMLLNILRRHDNRMISIMV